MRKILYILALILTVETVCFMDLHKRDKAEIAALSHRITVLTKNNETLIEENRALEHGVVLYCDIIDEQWLEINALTSEIEQLTSEIEQLKAEPIEAQKISRSGERRIMTVTAYDLSFQSCGKRPDHPLYGITASSKHVEEWNTIAAGPELPFGTKVFIPYFADKPNGGVFTVQDRGKAIKNGMLDVYMSSYDDCMEFGRRKLEVWVLD